MAPGGAAPAGGLATAAGGAAGGEAAGACTGFAAADGVGAAADIVASAGKAAAAGVAAATVLLGQGRVTWPRAKFPSMHPGAPPLPLPLLPPRMRRALLPFRCRGVSQVVEDVNQEWTRFSPQAHISRPTSPGCLQQLTPSL